jgi:hypothetical protein
MGVELAMQKFLSFLPAALWRPGSHGRLGLDAASPHAHRSASRVGGMDELIATAMASPDADWRPRRASSFIRPLARGDSPGK